MDTSQKTMKNWMEWCRFVNKSLPDQKFEIGFASHQWRMYWSGERGVDLSDLAIWLIDKFGY